MTALCKTSVNYIKDILHLQGIGSELHISMYVVHSIYAVINVDLLL